MLMMKASHAMHPYAIFVTLHADHQKEELEPLALMNAQPSEARRAIIVAGDGMLPEVLAQISSCIMSLQDGKVADAL